jgi:glucose-6-phosphate 1-dehydrogenase
MSLQTNPLQDGLRIEPTPGPTTLVIFGASGDLTRRKLLPALWSLSRGRRLPARFAAIGIARSENDDEGFRTIFRESLREFAHVDASGDEVASSLASRLFYLRGGLDDPSLYLRLRDKLKVIDGDEGVLFYLAVPPEVYGPVTAQLGQAGLSSAPEPAWRRIIIEKPFGIDLKSARELNRRVHEHFGEDQVFRIDHYLGKETVQNLLVFRFANGMFEPIWNRRYIDHVQITAAETVGVERRAAYYEDNATFENVVRAQYGDGWVSGQEVVGYRREPGVNAGSVTETYVAARLHLDSWRWAGVPFYVRTGKRMPKRTTEIAIQFRRPPLEIFRRVSSTPVASNLLIVNVQPDEGISIRFDAKLPATRMQLAPVMMNFRYGTAFGGEVPEAYETLLLDAMLGDATLFARHDFVEASWALISPIHERWQDEPVREIPAYEAGEWGPDEADALIARDGRRWRTL